MTLFSSFVLSSCLVVKVYQKSPEAESAPSRPVATDHRMIGSGETVEIDGTVSEILFYDDAGKPEKILKAYDEIIPTAVAEDSLSLFSQTGSKTTVKKGVSRSSSIQNAAPPLYVLNGEVLPQGFALDSLNPKDIERIDVYKGAKAMTLYGERGKHGVVIIRTVKGN